MRKGSWSCTHGVMANGCGICNPPLSAAFDALTARLRAAERERDRLRDENEWQRLDIGNRDTRIRTLETALRGLGRVITALSKCPCCGWFIPAEGHEATCELAEPLRLARAALTPVTEPGEGK